MEGRSLEHSKGDHTAVRNIIGARFAPLVIAIVSNSFDSKGLGCILAYYQETKIARAL